jgi:hypothetical protein
MADCGFWMRRRCADDCRHWWRAAAALTDEMQGRCRFNSPSGSVGDEAAGIPGDGYRG